jgi:hypothetical protein
MEKRARVSLKARPRLKGDDSFIDRSLGVVIASFAKKTTHCEEPGAILEL